MAEYRPSGLRMEIVYLSALMVHLPLREVWTGSVSGIVEKTYDNNVRIVEEKINGANNIVFSYDNDGLLVSVGK